jgi:Fe-S cluster assembly iron-binding protein IscA
MLTLSESAADVLSSSRSERGLSDSAHLRVAPADHAPDRGLSLTFVDEPMDGDETGESHGVSLCVAAEVAEALDGTTIDVQTVDERPQLVIVPAD